MRKTISASKDVSVLFITPGKAVWCSRFSAPLHSKKLTFESMVGRNFMLVKRLLSFCQLFLGKREVLNITIKGNNRKWDLHPVLFLQVLLGSVQRFAISKSVFFLLLEFTLSLSQDRCETAALEMSLASVKVRLEMFRKQACENSLVRLFPKRCLQSFELLLFVLSVAHSAATPAWYEVRLGSDQWWCSSKCCCQYVKKNKKNVLTS